MGICQINFVRPLILPNRAKRSPDVSWISHERWNALSDQDREGFARICPDFVLELSSPDATSFSSMIDLDPLNLRQVPDAYSRRLIRGVPEENGILLATPVLLNV